LAPPSRAAYFDQPTAATTRWRITVLPSTPLPVPGVGRAWWRVELIRGRARKAPWRSLRDGAQCTRNLDEIGISWARTDHQHGMSSSGTAVAARAAGCNVKGSREGLRERIVENADDTLHTSCIRRISI